LLYNYMEIPLSGAEESLMKWYSTEFPNGNSLANHAGS